MKKFILSLSLIVAFTVDTVYQRTGGQVLAFLGRDGARPRVIGANLKTSSSLALAQSQTTVAPPAPTTPVAVPATVVAEPITSPKPVAAKPTPPAPMVPVRPMPMMPAAPPRGPYRDGTYTGSVADAYYGNVQVQATIQNGFITDVQFLDYPQDRGTSIYINSQATPLLRQEAIQTQNAQVDTVSGATETSGAFRQSLGSALSQAS